MAKHLYIEGRVQGVGYRASSLRRRAVPAQRAGCATASMARLKHS
jgi:acylphosphatase